MFSEVVAHDAKSPTDHLLLALAMRDEPNRAARLCWEAVTRVNDAPAQLRNIVDAYQRYSPNEYRVVVDERLGGLLRSCRRMA